MLNLSRRVGERIMIGHDIVITVTKIDSNRNQVSIGIEAPLDIPVHREEIYDRIAKEDPNKTHR